MDKFVHLWEGGCRAGGAPWKNDAYTREGLKDTSRLTHGLMDGVESKVGMIDEAAARSIASGRSEARTPVGAVRRVPDSAFWDSRREEAGLLRHDGVPRREQ